MPGSKVWYCVNCGYEIEHRGRCHSCKDRLQPSPLPPLEEGDEEDEVGYRLDEWEDDERGRLIVALIRANVRHRFEEDELVVDSSDEQKADDLLADLRVVLEAEKAGEKPVLDHPSPLLAEDEEDDQAARLDTAKHAEILESLQKLHDSGKRLQADPTDMQADSDVAEFSASVFAVDEFPGIDEETWAAIGRVTRRLLAALGSDEALEDEIRTQASVLVKLLQPTVDPEAAEQNRLVRGGAPAGSEADDRDGAGPDDRSESGEASEADKASEAGEGPESGETSEGEASEEEALEDEGSESDKASEEDKDRSEDDDRSEDKETPAGDEDEPDPLDELRRQAEDAEASGDRRKAKQLRRELRKQERKERKVGSRKLGRRSGHSAGADQGADADRGKDAGEHDDEDSAESPSGSADAGEAADDRESDAGEKSNAGEGDAGAGEKSDDSDKTDADKSDADKSNAGEGDAGEKVEDKEADDDREDELAEADSGKEVVYELPEWLPEQRANLSVMLDAERIRHDWDGGDLVVETANEKAVDDIFTRIEDAEDQGDEGARYRSLEELFAAADRLAKDPDDKDRREDALDATEAGEGPTPVGLDDSQWWPIRSRVRVLQEVLEADASDARVADAAAALREQLRRYL